MNTIDQEIQETEPKTEERKFPVVKVLFGAIACFILLAFVILSNVQQLQLSNEIAGKQKEYTDLQSENVRMQTELAGKASNKNVQEYAEKVLGMHALNPSQVEYIQIQTADVVEIPEEEQNIFVKLKSQLDAFVAYMRG